MTLSMPVLKSAIESAVRADAATAYMLGIGGAGMRSLAVVLEQLGWRIIGSDANATVALPASWQRLPHDQLPPLATGDLVIHSPAMDAAHPLLSLAQRLGYETVSYPAMLGRLMQSRQGIAIAGTHGKSTTTAMAAAIFRQAGLNPTVVCGAEALTPATASGAGHGPHLLVEACEYRDSFLHLQPSVAAILNAEWDHCDWFNSLADVEAAFERFALQLPPEGTLVLPSGSQFASNFARYPRLASCRIVTFGGDIAADVRANHCRQQSGNVSFELVLAGQPAGAISLLVPGRHNVQNALAAAAVAHAVGIDGPSICQALNQFAGLRRRLEPLGHAGGVHFYDDYAHHPSEIAAGLQTLRQKHPGSRICCIFEPHQASRTKSLLYDLARSLQNADTLAIGEIFRARENAAEPPAVGAADLADACRKLGVWVFPEHDWATLMPSLVKARRQGRLADGDVVVTMGAGQIGTIAHDIYQRFRENLTHGRAIGAAHVV